MLRVLALLAFAALPASAFAQLAQHDPIAGVEGGRLKGAVTDAPLVEAVTSAPAPKEAKPQLFYVTRRKAVAYRDADSTRPYLQLSFREPLHVIRQQHGWSEVRTQGGARGYIPSAHLSNTWIRISKGEKSLYFYRGADLVEKLPIDLGFNTFADKERRGNARDKDHWRTPEGTFFIVEKNARSEYYKAFILNYPNAEDAEKGRRQNLITEKQYAAIIQAEQEFKMPPMNTPLGGMIEIHGNGTGKRTNWTQGCVAVTDAHMDRLWSMVEVGTPVMIEP